MKRAKRETTKAAATRAWWGADRLAGMMSAAGAGP